MPVELIHGEEIEMEWRVCKGGCGNRFKVMCSSPCVYARSRCVEECKGGREFGGHYVNGILIPPTSLKSQRDKFQELERWNRHIICANEILSGDNPEKPMVIAQLAINVCNFSRRSGCYSVVRFAIDLGLQQDELKEWIAIRRYVVNKLSDSLYSKGTYEAARRSYAKLKRSASDEEIHRVFTQEIQMK